MKYFFIISLGRSGTQFLSNLLNQVPNFSVKHEPFIEDKKLLSYSYSDSYSQIVEKLLQERFKSVNSDLDNNYNTYGEVNSYLRYNSDWLRNELNAKILTIVRDGRDFVKSAYGRTIYTNEEPQLSIIPKNGDSYVEKWPKMDRFEKLCWYWKTTNEYLFDNFGDDILKFEKLISDYEYFNKKILIPLNIDSLSYDKWINIVQKPKNTSKAYNIKKG